VVSIDEQHVQRLVCTNRMYVLTHKIHTIRVNIHDSKYIHSYRFGVEVVAVYEEHVQRLVGVKLLHLVCVCVCM
jgi:hypothetical protein